MASRIAALTPHQVAQVMAQPDVSTPLGIRDRAILELIWATAVRRDELVALSLDALHLRDRALIIGRGGTHERAVALDEHAATWLHAYLTDARPRLVPEPHPVVWVPADAGVLFVNHDGGPLDAAWLDAQVGRYIAAAGGGPGATHLLRFSACVRIFNRVTAGTDLAGDGREGAA